MQRFFPRSKARRVVRPSCRSGFSSGARARERASLDVEANEPGFWDVPARAAWVSRRLARLSEDARAVDAFARDAAFALELCQLLIEGASEALVPDLRREAAALDARARDLELLDVLGDPLAEGGALLIIHAEPGPDFASSDWVSDLVRMYVRWADARGARVDVQSSGDHRVVIGVDGRCAFGLLRGEAGVHVCRRRERELRARVRVLPGADDLPDVSVREEDLRIERFCTGLSCCSSRRGVALRVTHVPTGIVVFTGSCASEAEGRALALRELRAELAGRDLALPDQESRLVRTYELGPGGCGRVSDWISDAVLDTPSRVLDGELDPLLFARLPGGRGQRR